MCRPLLNGDSGKGDRMFEDGWNGGEVYHFYYRHDRAGDVELKVRVERNVATHDRAGDVELKGRLTSASRGC